MYKPLALLTAASLAALVATSTSTSAATTSPWRISPGGAATASADQVTLADSTSGFSATCASSALTLSFKKGSGRSNPIGTVTSMTFTGCTAQDGVDFSLDEASSSSNPAPLDAASYKDGVTTGGLHGITGSFSGSADGYSCSATLGGTTATAAGKISTEYTNSSATLETTGGNLHIWDVTGDACDFIGVSSGDAATITASYVISPAQAITRS